MNNVNSEENVSEVQREELQLLDVYSLAINFFLFLLLILFTLTNPNREVSKFAFILLALLSVFSLIMFLYFTVLMFVPKWIDKFRKFLVTNSNSRIKNSLRFTYIIALWISLPIMLLAGVIDIASNLPEGFRIAVHWTGISWLLCIPLASIIVFALKHGRHLRIRLPELPWLKILIGMCMRKFNRFIHTESPLHYLLIAIVITSIHIIASVNPVIDWLSFIGDPNSFLVTLWQVHASILGITFIVVTIIVTVTANEKDRTRTWKLYKEKTRFLLVVWFNLLSIISEGLAVLQASNSNSPIFLSDKVGNLVLSEGILLIASVILTAMLFIITMKFLDDDYIEEIAEKRILRSMPQAVDENIEHIRKVISQLQSKTNGT